MIHFLQLFDVQNQLKNAFTPLKKTVSSVPSLPKIGGGDFRVFRKLPKNHQNRPKIGAFSGGGIYG